MPQPALAYNATESCPKTSTRRSKRSILCRAPKPGSPGYNNGGGYNGGKNETGNGWNGGDHPTPEPMACELVAGGNVVFTANATIPAGAYVTFVSGLDVASVQGTISGSNIAAQIPAIALGQTYVLITSAAAAGGKIDPATVVAGPAIIEGRFQFSPFNA